jgi:hypothetical protein
MPGPTSHAPIAHRYRRLQLAHKPDLWNKKFGVNIIMIIFNTTYLLYLLTRSVPPLYFLTLKIKIDEACQI